jgi:hypothetical protein
MANGNLSEGNAPLVPPSAAKLAAEGRVRGRLPPLHAWAMLQGETHRISTSGISVLSTHYM